MKADIASILAKYCKNSRKLAQLYPYIVYYITNSRYYYIFATKHHTYLCSNTRLLCQITKPTTFYHNNWYYFEYSSEDLYLVTYHNISIVYAFGLKYYWRFNRNVLAFNYNVNGVYVDIEKLIAYYTYINNL
jgi:hypothetical protein